MQIFSATDPQAPEKAADVLEKGGLIIYPTDTLYGLGADATNRSAVRAIFSVKGRDEKKPVHVIVADLAMAETYARVTPLAVRLAARFLPGALTLVLEAKPSVLGVLRAGGTTIGIRIPKNDFCIALARAFGKPYTATSANPSGVSTGRNIKELRASFPHGFHGIDLVIGGGEVSGAPSTVVDARGEKPLCIREGALPFADIENA